MAEQTKKILPKEMVAKFDYPVSMKGREVTELTIRKPKLRDMVNHSKQNKTQLENEAWLMSALSDCPLSDFENLDIDQYKIVQDVLGKYTSPR